MDWIYLILKIWGLLLAGFIIGYCACALLSINKISTDPTESKEEAKS